MYKCVDVTISQRLHQLVAIFSRAKRVLEVQCVQAMTLSADLPNKVQKSPPIQRSRVPQAVDSNVLGRVTLC